MANEHQSNKARGNQNEGDGTQAPPPKPPATPADIAQAVSKVSATLADFTAPEQVRILTAVKFTNGLDQGQQQRPAQRPTTSSNNNNGNRGTR